MLPRGVPWGPPRLTEFAADRVLRVFLSRVREDLARIAKLDQVPPDHKAAIRSEWKRRRAVPTCAASCGDLSRTACYEPWALDPQKA